MDLGFEKSFGKLSITLIFEIFITFSYHISNESLFSGL